MKRDKPKCSVCSAFYDPLPIADPQDLEAAVASRIPEHDCYQDHGTRCGGPSKPCKKCKTGPLADDEFPK